MKEKVIIVKRDECEQDYYYDITHIMKKLMGDFVHQALLKIKTYYFIDEIENEEEAMNSVLEYIDKHHLDDENIDNINIYCNEILIEFTNWNKIEIGCSEYGEIRKI
jgi:hypothetical protein